MCKRAMWGGQFASVLLVLLAGQAMATVLRHLNTIELTRSSSGIVIAEVVSTRSYWNEARTRILTDVELKVSRTLKGVASERLVLTQLGGEVDGVRYDIAGSPMFKPGEEAVFFLWRDISGRTQVNGLAQGKFDIRPDPVTGERLVRRPVEGFEVADAENLSRPVGKGVPRVRLSDLVRVIKEELKKADR